MNLVSLLKSLFIIEKKTIINEIKTYWIGAPHTWTMIVFLIPQINKKVTDVDLSGAWNIELVATKLLEPGPSFPI